MYPLLPIGLLNGEAYVARAKYFSNHLLLICTLGLIPTPILSVCVPLHFQ